MKSSHTKTILFDGSFQGFLSAIFHIYEHRISVLDIHATENSQPALFGDTVVCPTEPAQARMVWNSLEKKGHQVARNIYFAFLSEQKGVALLLYNYIQYLVETSDAGAGLQSRIEGLANAVAHEKRRVEANLQLLPGQGDTEVAIIEPRYNILPLLTRNCRTRFPHRTWLLCDRRRQYGLYHRDGKMEFLSIRLTDLELRVPDRHLQIQLPETLSRNRMEYASQWRDASLKNNAA